MSLAQVPGYVPTVEPDKLVLAVPTYPRQNMLHGSSSQDPC